MTEPKPRPRTLFLIDGSSYIHRAYHALPPLSTRDGFPTNAVLGVATMLLKVLREQAPTHVAMVMDAPGPTFRDAIYTEYKATRPPMPEDLLVQLPRVDEVVSAFRVASVRQEGVEADDLIASMARRFCGEVDRVVIVSSDKDLMALVSDRVVMLDTLKDRWIGVAEVTERFGVAPERVPDVLALMGDSSDNIPGVPGVGPKTASRLVAQYGSLDEVMARRGEVRGKTGEALEKSQEAVALSRRLVALKDDIPLGLSMDDLAIQEPDREALRRLFTELEFTRLANDLAPASALGREGYLTVLSADGLARLAGNLRQAGRFAVDTETDSLDSLRAGLVGISFSWAQGQAAYVPLRHSYLGVPGQLPMEQVAASLGPVLADPAIGKIGQNLKFDIEVLARAGLPVAGPCFDTMLASWVLDPSRRSHGLTQIASDRLGHTMTTYDQLTRRGRAQVPFAEVAVEDASAYSCEDADVTYRVAGPLRDDLQKDGLIGLFDDLEMPLLRVLVDMETAGMLIDSAMLGALSRDADRELRAMEERIHAQAGKAFNVNSPRQLAQVLFEDLGLPVVRKTKTGYSTDDDVLLELSGRHHLPAMVRDYRSLSKLKSTYMDALPALVNPETGRLHTSFNQAATATGRLSSSEPNLQNIPVRSELGRRIRSAFVAPPGKVLLSADYSQIELRVLAHLSGDANLLEAFARGEDIHARTARQVLGAGEPVEPELRRRAKVVNFGIIYGMSAFGLSRELGVGPREAGEVIDGYFSVYSGVKRYLDLTLDEAKKTGQVTTLLGRRRRLPELSASNPAQRQAGERMAINTPIQGTAADLIKLAMIRAHEACRTAPFSIRMVLQVHDELVFEVQEDASERAAALVREAMEGVYALNVPLLVDVGAGKNWEEAH